METKLVAVEESTLKLYRAAAKENHALWEQAQEYKTEIQRCEFTRKALRAVTALYGLTLLFIGLIMAKHWNVVRSWF